MTPEEACTKAAEYIGEHGHTQDGKFQEESGRVCAMGALAKVTGAYQGVVDPNMGECSNGMWIDWGNRLFDQAAQLLGRQAGLEDHYSIPHWNDNLASTEDVILAMKRAGHS